MMSSQRKLVSDLVLVLGMSLLASAAMGCKKKTGSTGGGGGGGGGGAWLVGQDGLMENVLPDGALGEGYDLGADSDLYGITCRGLDTAFVAGSGGTLLRTFDGGESWESLDLGTTRTLRDVAAGGPGNVFVAGDHVLMMSRDSGDSWSAMNGGDRAWLSLATDHLGAVALVLDDAGGLWRYSDAKGSFTQVTTLAGAEAVTLSHDGLHAALVGDDGAFARSSDGGLTWSPVTTGTSSDLYAAWATGDGSIIAVGEAGTIVNVGDSVEVSQPGVNTLRAVHVDATGTAIVGGDAGEVLLSTDAGATWESLDLGLTRTVFSLDAVNGDGHL
jgi:photosystem II stability/assembly factor-like uncharacterized protein